MINNNNKIILFLLMLSFSFSGIIDDVEILLLNKYPDYHFINLNKYKIPKHIKNEIQRNVKQKFYCEQINIWKIVLNDSTIHYAFLDNTLGKSMPITFLQIVTDKGVINHTEVIKYREAYGGEIQNKNWLKQYLGKHMHSNFKIGREIHAISGATISVNSLNKSIQKLLLLLPYIKNETI